MKNNVLKCKYYFERQQQLLLIQPKPFILSNMMLFSNNSYLGMERDYYVNDLENCIQSNTHFDNLYSLMLLICQPISLLNSTYFVNYNLKTSNIIYNEEINNILLCDLYLNELRENDEINSYDLMFISPERLKSKELNIYNIIWSLGCIYFELLTKKYYIENMVIKNEIKEKDISIFIGKMLNKNEFKRITLEEVIIELKTFISKENKNEEINEIITINGSISKRIYEIDNEILKLPIVFPKEFYINCAVWKSLRDNFIKQYNDKEDDKILAILWYIKEYIQSYQLRNKLKLKPLSYSEMFFNIKLNYDGSTALVTKKESVYLCSDGIKYLFKMLKLTRQTKLKFSIDYIFKYLVNINLEPNDQVLFATQFIQLTNIQDIDLSECLLHNCFFEPFVQTIPYLKLNSLKLGGIYIIMINIYLFRKC